MIFTDDEIHFAHIQSANKKKLNWVNFYQNWNKLSEDRNSENASGDNIFTRPYAWLMIHEPSVQLWPLICHFLGQKQHINNFRINLPSVGVLSSPWWANWTVVTIGASNSSRNEMLSSDGSTSHWYIWPVSVISCSLRVELVASTDFSFSVWEFGPGKNTRPWKVSSLFSNSTALPVCCVHFLSLNWVPVRCARFNWLIACSDVSVGFDSWVWIHFEVCKSAAWRLHFDREINSPLSSREILKA